MASSYENVISKIMEFLQADETLSSSIKAWHFGVHDVRKPATTYPYVSVFLIGGPVKPATTGKKQKEMSYTVAVVDRHTDVEVAEKNAMSLNESAESVLDGNKSLDGLVQDSELSAVNMDRVIMGEYAIIGVAFTLYTRSFKTYS